MSKETLKSRIEYILQICPEARNCDKRLAVEFWKVYEGVDMEAISPFMDLQDVPSLKRIRAEFQHNKEYLPTNIEVVRQRRQNEREWREALGYPVEDLGQQTMFEGVR